MNLHLCLFSARLNIQYPMLFKLTNKRTNRETHCGVLEFVADEGRIYLPYWVRFSAVESICWCYPFSHSPFPFSVSSSQMMTNLLLEEGSLVHLENISLPVATFAKFEPQSVDFLDISNPKAVYPLVQMLLMTLVIYLDWFLQLVLGKLICASFLHLWVCNKLYLLLNIFSCWKLQCIGVSLDCSHQIREQSEKLCLPYDWRHAGHQI